MKRILLAFGLALAAFLCHAQTPIGEVNSAFVLLGPDHKILVEAYDDPK